MPVERGNMREQLCDASMITVLINIPQINPEHQTGSDVLHVTGHADCFYMNKNVPRTARPLSCGIS
jgi:hypothetical protein